MYTLKKVFAVWIIVFLKDFNFKRQITHLPGKIHWKPKWVGNGISQGIYDFVEYNNFDGCKNTTLAFACLFF